MGPKKLEDIAKDPLDMFDHASRTIYGDIKDPKILQAISEYRREIENEPIRYKKYFLVAQYMAISKAIHTGETG